jgi:hypothetical protein
MSGTLNATASVNDPKTRPDVLPRYSSISRPTLQPEDIPFASWPYWISYLVPVFIGFGLVRPPHVTRIGESVLFSRFLVWLTTAVIIFLPQHRHSIFWHISVSESYFELFLLHLWFSGFFGRRFLPDRSPVQTVFASGIDSNSFYMFRFGKDGCTTLFCSSPTWWCHPWTSFSQLMKSTQRKIKRRFESKLNLIMIATRCEKIFCSGTNPPRS